VHVYLTTDRMVLRRFTADDLDLIVELDSDPAVKRYIDGGLPVDRAESQEMLDWWLGYHERSEPYGFWVAIERASGDFLGWFHLRPDVDDAPDEPELGYRLRRSAWGRGFATEGSKALIERAFTDLAATRVHASTMTVNTGSRRVMEKAGLRFVRTFHLDWPVSIPGDEEGDVEYSITREEWLADRSPG
jgi:RimJ/RimL family protein N-acetyltransferase